MFVSCNGPKKRGIKVGHLFLSKMCVLCMFYADWELGGRKNFRVGIFFE